ncbi:CRISPR-associated helicase Cas3' [Chloroflexus sp.]|uniref:CRISPR-associated helicase Cas3' n=1 Tax=Chloroflexus sp. TaxID=1904827 RepID=UPI00404A7560
MQLYPYQQRVKDLILAGENVVLQAPTGAGKTRAALAPFIEGFFDRPDSTPRKCLYVTPMRVLANQFYAEYRELAARYQRLHGRQLDVRIQTGEQPEDRRFEGDLIFCTVDQFLSSYLMMPYSLPYRLANVNAGALAGAYLVFDEFHLFDPDAALPTILHVLKQLRGLAPFMLMTATFSSAMLQALATLLQPAQVVTLAAAEIAAINTRGGQPARQRVWQVADQPLQAAAVLAHHQHASLVICNTVRRAREVYAELKQQAPPETEVLLLHSQFLPDDRRQIEAKLRSRLGASAQRRQADLIVVATQVVEVGVDISVEVLHTELAPPASLIQRAGRCARYPGDTGTVIVYPVATYVPYAFKPNETLKHEMDATLAWLKKRQGAVFDFDHEQELVNAVSAARDQNIIAGIQADRLNRRASIQGCLEGQRAGASRLLVRDVDSRLVLIHPDPDQLLASPYDAVGLNIPLYSLRSMGKDWLQRPTNAPWRVRRLDESDAGDQAESNRPLYRWVDVHDSKELAQSAIIVVHPALAGYSAHEGFSPETGDLPFISTLPPARPLIDRPRSSLYVETYAEHIQRVLDAFQELALPELRFVASALECAAGWSPGSMLRAAWLACLFHDVGKLSKGWQQWAHAYQQAIGQPVAKEVALAHTTFDFQNPTHRQAEQQVSRSTPRPRHAAEGALAVAQVLAGAFNISSEKELVQAILTAIARHHAPFVQDCQAFSLVPKAGDLIQNTLEFLPAEVTHSLNLNALWMNSHHHQQFADLLIKPTNRYGWIAYTLLARALRRADQRGTEMGAGQTLP